MPVGSSATRADADAPTADGNRPVSSTGTDTTKHRQAHQQARRAHTDLG